MGNDSISPQKRYYLYIILAILTLAVYSNAVTNDFVFDDNSLVVTNPWIKDVRYIPEIFSSGAWSFEGRDSNYYRPLVHIIYMAVYYISGLKPAAFHIANILFHTAVSILVLLISFKIFGSGTSFRNLFPPLSAALLFATHPVHTEAVSWVAGMFDLSFTFFYLLSFYLYIRSEHRYSIAYILSVASFFLATMCKEPAVTLPLILAAYDYAFADRQQKPRNIWIRYIPYCAALIINLILRYRAIGGLSPLKISRELPLFEQIINIAVLFSDYMGKLLVPFNLNAWHVFIPERSAVSLTAIISLIVFCAFLFFLVLSFWKKKIVFLSLTMILLPLAPALYIPALTQGSENVFAERYLYLPSFGFVLLAGMFVGWLAEKKSGKSFIIAIVLLAITLLYSAGTINRNFAWKDNLSLWSDSVKKSPGSAKAHELLGFALLKKGKNEEGRQHLQRALHINPELLNETISKGTTYAKKGYINKAIFEFVAAAAIKPDSAEAHYNLAIAYDSLDWGQMAIEEYKKTLFLAPDFAEAHNNLGIRYSIEGALDEAVIHFQEAVKLNPDDPSFHYNLAKAYDMKGLSELAAAERELAEQIERE